MSTTAHRVNRRRTGRLSLAARLFLAELVIVVALCATFMVLSYNHTRVLLRQAAASQVLSLAQTLAHDPFVVAGVQSARPSDTLEPYALDIDKTASVDFVTIMDRDGIRYTHPDPAQIGRPYIGSTAAARAGHSQVEQFTGTLGPSVRAIVPIFDSAGQVTAMVAVGVTIHHLAIAEAAAVPQILTAGLIVLAVGALAAWLLGRYLRRTTLGYRPAQLRRLFTYYHSALHSLREGLMLVNENGDLVLYNDQAAQLLDIAPFDDDRPSALGDLHLPASLHELLASGRTVADEAHVTGERILIVTQQPAVEPGRPGADASPRRRRRGSVVTIRDRTEVQTLAGELASMTSLSDALRSQTHEHANRLHLIATLVELGRTREAIDLAVRDQQQAQQLTDHFVQSLDEPFITALLIGKTAQAHERGIRLGITASGTLPPQALDALDLVTITGNLIDNAFDAAAESEERRVWADFTVADDALVITVADSGPGIPADEVETVMRMNTSSKPDAAAAGHGYGLTLVRQAVARLRGTIEVETDGGAIITVTIPLAADRVGRVAASSDDAASGPTASGDVASADGLGEEPR